MTGRHKDETKRDKTRRKTGHGAELTETGLCSIIGDRADERELTGLKQTVTVRKKKKKKKKDPPKTANWFPKHLRILFRLGGRAACILHHGGDGPSFRRAEPKSNSTLYVQVTCVVAHNEIHRAIVIHMCGSLTEVKPMAQAPANRSAPPLHETIQASSMTRVQSMQLREATCLEHTEAM